jgi:hypothetical protein
MKVCTAKNRRNGEAFSHKQTLTVEPKIFRRIVMRTFWHDLRHSARLLLKKPGFTAVAVIMLGLGIGANSAIFSVVHGVLLQPFSFAEPEPLVVIWERALKRGLPRMVVSPPNFADWRAQNQTFQEMAAYRPQDFNLTGSGDPEQVRELRVSAEMFSMLGVRPLLGRDFQPGEDGPGKPAAVIISHGFWQHQRSAHNLFVLARLKKGVTQESAIVAGGSLAGLLFASTACGES